MGSTNQSKITIKYQLIVKNAVRGDIPFSLSIGGFFKKVRGLFSFRFLLGRPITVFSAPLGLPLFIILGGSLTLSRPVIMLPTYNNYKQILYIYLPLFSLSESHCVSPILDLPAMFSLLSESNQQMFEINGSKQTFTLDLNTGTI